MISCLWEILLSCPADVLGMTLNFLDLKTVVHLDTACGANPHVRDACSFISTTLNSSTIEKGMLLLNWCIRRRMRINLAYVEDVQLLPRLVTHQDMVDSIDLAGTCSTVLAWAESSLVHKVHALALDNEVNVSKLPTMERFRNLRRLVCRSLHASEAWYVAVLQNNPQLEFLSLATAEVIGESLLTAMNRCPNLSTVAVGSQASGSSLGLDGVVCGSVTTLMVAYSRNGGGGTGRSLATRFPSLQHLCVKLSRAFEFARAVTLTSSFLESCSQLRTLSCPGINITDSTLTALAASCPLLEVLQGNWVVLSLSVVQQSAPLLSRLLTFTDSRDRRGHTRAAQSLLLALLFMSAVRDLEVMLEIESAKAGMAIQMSCSNLRRLALRCGETTLTEKQTAAFRALALKNPHMTHFSADVPLKDVTVGDMARCWPALQCLELTSCDTAVSDAALVTVAEQCPQLQVLTLKSSSLVTDNTVFALAQHCRALHTLRLPLAAQVTGTALAHLHHRCRRLRVLEVHRCSLGVAEVRRKLRKVCGASLRLAGYEGEENATSRSSGTERNIFG